MAVLFEKGDYWIASAPNGGFEIYKNGVTHSVRCAQIGFQGVKGFRRAKQEIDRRIVSDENQNPEEKETAK